ncbi:transglycosylase family protein [Streptomyces sp. NPDC051569]|uniref:transglycosylase family protein n=1 Tax=Streptomyces sp. NPDC051569 TaxID=3365661 RepID=UPI0037A339A7
MRSGNGRHRRPRQAPALIVAAGVTGSAIAIPLLGAGAAGAADATTWNRVADCETGGMWSADLGNGYYGGLQLSQQTWDSFGGAQYAARADLASRAQQISIAEKVLAAQGPKAWASCAPLSGLTNDGTLPDVNPGSVPRGAETAPESRSTGAAASTPSPGASTGGDSATGTGTGTKGSADERTGSGSSTAPTSGASGATDATGQDDSDPATGKHRGTAAPNDATSDNTDEERESGRHASRGDGSARGSENVTDGIAGGITDGVTDGSTDAITGGGTGAADAADAPYTVLPGDSLWNIADQQKVSGGWTAIYEANKDTVGSDPDLILPGQSLDLGVK